MLVRSVPVDPDAPTARRWLEDELTDPAYNDRPSFLEMFLEWLGDLFTGLTFGTLSGPWGALLIVGVFLAVGIVTFVVTGPVRRTRSVSRAPAVFDDDVRTADELAASAARAAAAGDFTTATLDAFRTIVRRSEERVLLDPRPGRTAHEAAEELAPQFATAPATDGLAVALAAAAAQFDALCYGKTSADESSYAFMTGLERTLVATRPQRGAPVTTS